MAQQCLTFKNIKEIIFLGFSPCKYIAKIKKSFGVYVMALVVISSC